jgi:hypothetical protein
VISHVVVDEQPPAASKTRKKGQSVKIVTGYRKDTAAEPVSTVKMRRVARLKPADEIRIRQ